ncbi:hypothetical protein BV20DRAFT_1026949 [Pilatotrama ljubarskyi]|nr:hypothetical protein BV20DRAFT_1026949 [Pilatotrama ljubarskyi]
MVTQLVTGRAPLWIAGATAAAGIVVFVYSSRLKLQTQIRSEEHLFNTTRIRRLLPRTLSEWSLAVDEAYDPIWHVLQDYLKARGYIIWYQQGDYGYLRPPKDTETTFNGFASAPVHRGLGAGSRLAKLSSFFSPNSLNRAARSLDGRDVVIRVICVGSEGRSQLEVLKYISRGPLNQATPNHAIPLFELFDLEDVTFGVFPRVGFNMFDAYNSWPENSVGDIVDMIMQGLEALGFLHSIGVAHRDAFKDNFLVQWFPESMASDQLTVSRPRVFLNDFETAVRFPDDVPPHARTCVGLPLCPTFPSPERYFRNLAAELTTEQPYDPFKLDVWQFGDSFYDFRTTIPDIDAVLSAMRDDDPDMRISALDALKRISSVVNSMPPESLRIAPTIVPE